MVAPKITPEEEANRWDWRKEDKERKDWFEAVKKLETLKIYDKTKGYKPVSIAPNLNAYLNSLILSKNSMVNEKVLTVPQELKYVGYLLEVIELLENLKRTKSQEKAYKDNQNLIEQKIQEITNLKDSMIKNLNWATQRLFWIVLEKKEKQKQQASQQKGFWGKVQQQESSEEESESDDSDWDV